MFVYKVKDKDKFYKRLYFCKLFKFNFKTDIKDKELSLIIDALNIKRRRKRIEFIYDVSCNIIDENNKGVTCGFKNNKCYAQYDKGDKYVCGCCRRCRYQSNKGCTTTNLSCKLFNCSEVTKRYDVVKYEDLKILKLLSIKNRFIIKSNYFCSRKDALKDLYSYSLIYSTFRVLYRLIRDYFYVNKYFVKKGKL